MLLAAEKQNENNTKGYLMNRVFFDRETLTQRIGKRGKTGENGGKCKRAVPTAAISSSSAMPSFGAVRFGSIRFGSVRFVWLHCAEQLIEMHFKIVMRNLCGIRHCHRPTTATTTGTQSNNISIDRIAFRRHFIAHSN